jgi:hypothetical protein
MYKVLKCRLSINPFLAIPFQQSPFHNPPTYKSQKPPPIKKSCILLQQVFYTQW